jgi:uncharacterized protein YPO0396
MEKFLERLGTWLVEQTSESKHFRHQVMAAIGQLSAQIQSLEIKTMASISEVMDALSNLSAIVDAETIQITAKLEEIKATSAAEEAAELDKVIAQVNAIGDKVKAEIPDAPAPEPTEPPLGSGAPGEETVPADPGDNPSAEPV